MEQEYKIISVLGNDTKVVEMNDKSGFTFVYPDGKISSGRYGEIGKFDETGYATIKRVGESEVCALLDKDGNIYKEH